MALIFIVITIVIIIIINFLFLFSLLLLFGLHFKVDWINRVLYNKKRNGGVGLATLVCAGVCFSSKLLFGINTHKGLKRVTLICLLCPMLVIIHFRKYHIWNEKKR